MSFGFPREFCSWLKVVFQADVSLERCRDIRSLSVKHVVYLVEVQGRGRGTGEFLERDRRFGAERQFAGSQLSERIASAQEPICREHLESAFSCGDRFDRGDYECAAQELPASFSA